MPEDVRAKKIGSCALKAAQSGQYNYARCIKHGEDGAAMLARIGSGAFVVAMCIEGKGYSSEELASLVAQCAVQGKSRVCFLIGGSDGLSDEVKRAADVRLSMSRMTFPHHLARVMVLEQIYCAFNINEGGKYHK